MPSMLSCSPFPKKNADVVSLRPPDDLPKTTTTKGEQGDSTGRAYLVNLLGMGEQGEQGGHFARASVLQRLHGRLSGWQLSFRCKRRLVTSNWRLRLMIKEMADYPGPRLNREQMRTFLEYGSGNVGLAAFHTWEEFNARFFDDQLCPIPLVLVATSPWGHWTGCTHWVLRPRRTAYIALTAPYNKTLRSDRGVLLHEMIHALLVERGESPK